MPELDGFGVVAALRGTPETESIPFIFLTAKGEKHDVRTAMSLGADDYLTKPVAKSDLLGAIRSRLCSPLSTGCRQFGCGRQAEARLPSCQTKQRKGASLTTEQAPD
jgi:CheY-like chemotaxis protein